MSVLLCNAEEFRSLGRQILRRGAAIRYRAAGWSMYPLIRHGDILEIQPIQASAVRVGDVILFETEEGGVLAHRLIHKQGADNRTLLTTKGDALAHPDKPIHADKLLGRVTRIERRGRTIGLDRPLPRLLGRLWAKWPAGCNATYRFLARVGRIVLRGRLRALVEGRI